MIDMMDVITQGEGGWLPQTNTHMFTDILTNTDTDTNTYTYMCTYIYSYIYSITDTDDRYDGWYRPRKGGLVCTDKYICVNIRHVRYKINEIEMRISKLKFAFLFKNFCVHFFGFICFLLHSV